MTLDSILLPQTFLGVTSSSSEMYSSSSSLKANSSSMLESSLFALILAILERNSSRLILTSG